MEENLPPYNGPNDELGDIEPIKATLFEDGSVVLTGEEENEFIDAKEDDLVSLEEMA